MAVQKRVDLATTIADLKRRVATLERTNRLNHASITEGGLSVRNGGSVWIKDGGDLRLQDSGDLIVEDGGNLYIVEGGEMFIQEGGDLNVIGGSLNFSNGGFAWLKDGASFYQDGTFWVQSGGNFYIRDGGSFVSLYPNNQIAAYFGPAAQPSIFDQGFILQDNDATPVIWLTRMNDGSFRSNFGVGGKKLEYFTVMSDSILFVDLPNTGAGANLHVSAGNQIFKSTSSRRYKTDIADAPPIKAQDVINLRLRTFRDKTAVEENPEEAPTYTGLVAEEVAETPSLRPFVTFNEAGEPDAIQYDRLWLALLPVIQEQQTLIDTLVRQVAELTARVDSLSS